MGSCARERQGAGGEHQLAHRSLRGALPEKWCKGLHCPSLAFRGQWHLLKVFLSFYDESLEMGRVHVLKRQLSECCLPHMEHR